MPTQIDGKTFNTIADAARRAKVSTKTFQSYINKGIVSAPPRVKHGLREIQVFPKEYLQKAIRQLADRARQKQKSRSKVH